MSLAVAAVQAAIGSEVGEGPTADALRLIAQELYALEPVVAFGQTPGLAANESVILTFDNGEQALALDNGNAYGIEVDAVVAAVDSIAGDVARTIIRNRAVARQVGGTLTLVSGGTVQGQGDASTNLYTLALTVVSNKLVLTFATGAGTTALAHVHAEVSFLTTSFIT